MKNLRQLRMSKGVSQQKLADLLGISQQAVYKYERQKIEPDIATLIALADYFGTTVDHLIGHEPERGGERSQEDFELSREEWALLRDFRALSQSEKDSILAVIQNYRKK